MVVREVACSARGMGFARQPCQEVVLDRGGCSGKLVCAEAGAYELHLKKVELVVVPVCSGSYQRIRIAPRVYPG